MVERAVTRAKNDERYWKAGELSVEIEIANCIEELKGKRNRK